MTQPVLFFKCLSDETRLRCVALLHKRGELCVCELTQALGLSQPKISRHLALLRASGVLSDRRQGAWVYYRLHPDLPAWALAVLDELASGIADLPVYRQDLARLQPIACQPSLAEGTDPIPSF